MGLSNYIASSRISQSGVCTSSTRPASPYEGQVIYETDTDRVLVWNASAWVAPNSQTANPPGLELVTGVGCSAGGTASNGVVTVGSAVSSVTVTNAFSASYDNYRITLNGGSSSTNGEVRMILGSTNSGYFQNVVYTAWNNTVQAASTNNGSIWTLAGVSDPDGSLVSFDIFNPFLSRRTMCGGPFIGADADRVGGYMSGYVANTVSYTDFTFNLSSGTMTGGTIRVYGYRN